jgi:hypothetical protein
MLQRHLIKAKQAKSLFEKGMLGDRVFLTLPWLPILPPVLTFRQLAGELCKRFHRQCHLYQIF